MVVLMMRLFSEMDRLSNQNLQGLEGFQLQHALGIVRENALQVV